MSTLTLYTNPMSRGRIARWACEELVEATGLSYEAQVLDFATTMKAPDYLAINPMGKVPAIRHGAVVVTEAPAICAYLADAFPQAYLAPPVDSPLRGAYYRWLFFAAGPIEQAVTFAAMKIDVPKEREGMVGFGSMARVLDTLERAVEGGGWLAGDDFTMADLYLGAALGWGMGFGTLEARPAFAAFVERVNARPAARRAKAIDDALVPADRRR